MVPITMPRFVSASTSERAQERVDVVMTQGINQTPNVVTPQQRDFGDNLDFDLLAEYLLDDVNLPPPVYLETNQTNNSGQTFVPGFGHQNATGLVSNGGTPPEHNDVALLAATRADPLVDGSVAIKNGGALVSASGDIATDLQHVQQLIVHQANSNVNMEPNINLNNRIPQIPLPTMDHKNYINGTQLQPPQQVVGMNHAPGATPVYAIPPQSVQNSNKRQRIEFNRSNKVAMPVLAQKPAAKSANSNNEISMPRQKRKSQAQIDRRRERNRILARRTRLRKKFFFESLQKEVVDLQKENAALRNIVKTSIEPTQANTILDNCKKAELPPIVIEELGMMSGGLDQQDFCLVKSLKHSQQCFIITDPSLQDNPIVYASDDFLTLTGYARDSVLGRNCRFLQGADTDKSKIDLIRKGVSEGEDVSVCLLNYTADGTPFWNKLFIAALRDTQNNIVNFIGVTVKVSGPAPDDPESDQIDDIGNSLDEEIADMTTAAEDTSMAIDGAVTAAVEAAPSVSDINNIV